MASPRRKEATAWSGGAELSGRGDPGERAGENDSDAIASRPDRRPDPGGLGTPSPQSPCPLAQLGLGMICSSLWFTRLRTSVSFAERLSHFGGDQLGIACVAIWPLCKCLRAQKTWNLKFPYSRIRAKHVEVAAPSSSCRSTAFVQPSFCVGCATQKLLIRFRHIVAPVPDPVQGHPRIRAQPTTRWRCMKDPINSVLGETAPLPAQHLVLPS
jgi:hypothetical protein